MDRSDLCQLEAYTYTEDTIGQRIPTATITTVYCKIDSVSGTEWSEAVKNGINAQLRITMFEPDYGGQKTVIVNGKRYGVYRTYHSKNDMIELYLEEKVGV